MSNNTTVLETLKLKQTPVDLWNIREQLALAKWVLKSGSQNWSSVARSLKHELLDEDRPPDWFSPKNCALQYNLLLEKAEKPARIKKRHSVESKPDKIESQEEMIVRQLKGLRVKQLNLEIDQEAAFIKQIENNLSVLRSSDLSDEQICKIEESIKREEEEELERSTAKERWLREREVKKRSLQLKIKCLGSGIEPVRISILKPEDSSGRKSLEEDPTPSSPSNRSSIDSKRSENDDSETEENITSGNLASETEEDDDEEKIENDNESADASPEESSTKNDESLSPEESVSKDSLETDVPDTEMTTEMANEAQETEFSIDTDLETDSNTLAPENSEMSLVSESDYPMPENFNLSLDPESSSTSSELGKPLEDSPLESNNMDLSEPIPSPVKTVPTELITDALSPDQLTSPAGTVDDSIHDVIATPKITPKDDQDIEIDNVAAAKDNTAEKAEEAAQAVIAEHVNTFDEASLDATVSKVDLKTKEDEMSNLDPAPSNISDPDIHSTNIEAILANVDIHATDLDSTNTKTDSTNIDIIPTNMDTSLAHFETDSTNTEICSTNIDVIPTNIDPVPILKNSVDETSTLTTEQISTAITEPEFNDETISQTHSEDKPSLSEASETSNVNPSIIEHCETNIDINDSNLSTQQEKESENISENIDLLQENTNNILNTSDIESTVLESTEMIESELTEKALVETPTDDNHIDSEAPSADIEVPDESKENTDKEVLTPLEKQSEQTEGNEPEPHKEVENDKEIETEPEPKQIETENFDSNKDDAETKVKAVPSIEPKLVDTEVELEIHLDTSSGSLKNLSEEEHQEELSQIAEVEPTVVEDVEMEDLNESKVTESVTEKPADLNEPSQEHVKDVSSESTEAEQEQAVTAAPNQAEEESNESENQSREEQSSFLNDSREEPSSFLNDSREEPSSDRVEEVEEPSSDRVEEVEESDDEMFQQFTKGKDKESDQKCEQFTIIEEKEIEQVFKQPANRAGEKPEQVLEKSAKRAEEETEGVLEKSATRTEEETEGVLKISANRTEEETEDVLEKSSNREEQETEQVLGELANVEEQETEQTVEQLLNRKEKTDKIKKIQSSGTQTEELSKEVVISEPSKRLRSRTKSKISESRLSSTDAAQVTENKVPEPVTNMSKQLKSGKGPIVQLESALKEKDEAEDSLNRSADSLGLSANDLMSQSGDESTSDIIKFSRPTFDRNTYRRTYSKKEDWAIGDEELASNSASSTHSASEEEMETEALRLTRSRRQSDIPLPVVSKEEDDKARKEWRRQATAVINNAKFHKAVTRLLASSKDENYNQVVKKSKTLTSIKQDIELGLIRTVEDLKNSMALLFANMAMFHKSNVEEHDRLIQLYNDFNNLVKGLIISRQIPISGNKRSSLPNLDTNTAKRRRR